MSCADGRFVAHPTFKFACANMKIRKQAAIATTYAVNQMPEHEPLDLQGLRDILNLKNPQERAAYETKIGCSILAYGRGNPGSPSFWGGRREELASLLRHILFHEDEMPVMFLTHSLSEYHLRPLHRMLHQCLTLWGVKLMTLKLFGHYPLEWRLQLTKQQQFIEFSKSTQVLLMAYSCSVFMKEGLKCTDYWRRFEFAKGRGSIHCHGIIFNKLAATNIHSVMDSVLNASSEEELEEIEDIIAQRLPADIEEDLVKISALHPSGRERSFPELSTTIPWYTGRIKAAKGELPEEEARHFRAGCEDVSPEKVGNIDLWPPHEGLSPPATSDCLRRRTFDVIGHEATLADDIDIANRVRLHECSEYCLRSFKKIVNEVEIVIKKCRAHFGDRESSSACKDGWHAC